MNDQNELKVSANSLKIDSKVTCGPMPSFTKVGLDPMDEAACEIANTIASDLIFHSFDYETSRTITSFGIQCGTTSRKTTRMNTADAILTIAETTDNVATAYIAQGPLYSNSANFACHLLNALSDFDTAIVPVAIDDSRIVDSNRIGVYLELGHPEVKHAEELAGVIHG